MSFSAHSTAIHPSKTNGDTVLIARSRVGLIYGIFDGAGSSPYDEKASFAVAECIAKSAPALRSLASLDWEQLCVAVSEAAEHEGTTTATLCHVIENEVECLSVGDSEAWLIGEDLVELSGRQPRGRLGAHNFEKPTLLRAEKASGTLYLASDGVHRYICAEAVAAHVLAGSYAADIIGKVKEKTGSLRDDSSVILVSL